ncbi:MAG: HDIG domain-containing protein [Methanoregulaceae archaeon]|nr:HDIG domain-containing protein [Methanoregulaceae archaeon]
MQSSPGTYQHSLQVANLAEQAAEAIGADPLLTRVGSIYHDAGKAVNPTFFVENQVTGMNPHDSLDPFSSAEIILRHVTDGAELGRKFRLPRRLIDFMLEHHGTLITRYQYARAVLASNGDESKVDIELFRYPGPRPKSRETALLMLADNCEARVRANPPKDEKALRQMIDQAFEYVQQQHQLDDTRLSIKDLHLASESFFHTLQNMYHPRIPYPEYKNPPSSINVDTLPILEAKETDEK